MTWLGIIFFAAVGGLLGILTQKFVQFVAVARAKKTAREIIQEAESKANASDQLDKDIETQIEEYEQKLSQQISNYEQSLEKQEGRHESLRDRITSREEMIEKNKNQIEEQSASIDNLETEWKSVRSQYIEKLEEKSGEDREEILHKLERELKSQAELTASRMIKSHENTIDTHQDRLAKHVLGSVIPRCDIVNPTDISTAVLKFPDSDAFQQFETFFQEHHDKIVEQIDTDVRIEPEDDMAVIETLEPVQKEIAYRTLNNIIQQKKFHYELVEEGLQRYKSQVENEQLRAARTAMKRCNVEDVPDRMVRLLGVLQFRTSYGQHQLTHSKEVAHLGDLMAREIGADPELTRRAGLLHDIGKAIDRQRESGHAVIGAEIAEEEGEHPIVVNGIGSHHGDMEPNSVESLIVAAADAISGSRPGARRENVTNYSERIESLLELAENRRGVQKVYAMNAGRELRVRVDRNQIRDEQMEELAREIAHDIENELTYSGEIKINTIRETQITRKAHSKR